MSRDFDEVDLVLDASVAMKWYLQAEPFKAQAQRVLDRFVEGAIRLSAPTLIQWELRSALARAAAGQRISTQTATQALIAFDALRVDLHPPGPLTASQLDIFIRTRGESRGMGTYDAAYAAVAQQSGVVLITADQALYQGCRLLEIDVTMLGEYG